MKTLIIILLLSISLNAQTIQKDKQKHFVAGVEPYGLKTIKTFELMGKEILIAGFGRIGKSLIVNFLCFRIYPIANSIIIIFCFSFSFWFKKEGYDPLFLFRIFNNMTYSHFC